MLGPSGFFQADGPGKTYSDSSELELIHTSEGGFNEMYRGMKNGRFFVYKALKKEFRGNMLYEELLKKDFNIGFSLNHSGICQYYAMIDHPSVGRCIVMEWIDRCTLESLVRERKKDRELMKKVICETCDALDYMHRKQVIHRDLKPENIIVTHNGQNAKIIDFGLSDADSYRNLKAPAGTRLYASPELEAGETIDNRSDIWSLGVIINEISPNLRHIAARCLRRDKNRRYSSAIEVKEAVMREGTRRMAMFLVSFLMLAGLAAWGMRIMDNRRSESAAEPVPQTVTADTTVFEEPAERPLKNAGKAEMQAPSDAKKSDTEKIDASSLEDLFDEAARQLL